MSRVVKLEDINYETLSMYPVFGNDGEYFMLNQPILFETPWEPISNNCIPEYSYYKSTISEKSVLKMPTNPINIGYPICSLLDSYDALDKFFNKQIKLLKNDKNITFRKIVDDTFIRYKLPHQKTYHSDQSIDEVHEEFDQQLLLLHEHTDNDSIPYIIHRELIKERQFNNYIEKYAKYIYQYNLYELVNSVKIKIDFNTFDEFVSHVRNANSIKLIVRPQLRKDTSNCYYVELNIASILITKSIMKMNYDYKYISDFKLPYNLKIDIQSIKYTPETYT